MRDLLREYARLSISGEIPATPSGLIREFIELVLERGGAPQAGIEATESLTHPLAGIDGFTLSSKKSKEFRYELSLPYKVGGGKNKEDPQKELRSLVVDALKVSFRGAKIEVLQPGDGSVSGKFPTYVVSKAGKALCQIVVTSPKNLLADGVVAILAERAILHALVGGTYEDAIAEESKVEIDAKGKEQKKGRLHSLAAAENDELHDNLKQVYERLKSLASDALKEKNIEGGGQIPEDNTAKVDVLAGNADIHVKYNDHSRLIGFQDVKKAAATSGNVSSVNKLGKSIEKKNVQRAVQVAKAAESTGNEFPNSTSLFRTLRNKFVEDLKIPKTRTTFGAQALKEDTDAIGVMTRMNLEAAMLYKDASIRSQFIQYLVENGYVDMLQADVEKFVVSSSQTGKGKKSTYFFVYSGKKPKSDGLIDPRTISLDLKQFQVKTPTSKEGKSIISVIPQTERVNVYLFKVAFNGTPLMKVEFRTVSGGGHPPQLHLDADEIPSDILKISKFE